MSQYDNNGYFGGTPGIPLPAPLPLGMRGPIVSNGTVNQPLAGQVGEIITASSYGSPFSLTTGSIVSLVSIELTPGLWDVSNITLFASTTASPGPDIQQILVDISTVLNTFQTVNGRYSSTKSAPTSDTDQTLVIPPFRLAVAALTTLFVVVRVNFISGNIAAVTKIDARRVNDRP